jgi:hypothetical protein
MRVPTIKARSQFLVFLPDRVLMKSGLHWSDVEYSHLTVKDAQSRFIEHKSPPRDGTKVDERWQYTNVKGGPDKRFKNNRRLPVMLYDEVSLTSDTGLSWIMQLSQHDPARWWEAILKAHPVSDLPSPSVAAPATLEYAAKYASASIPQSRSATRTEGPVPVSKNSARPNVSQPPQWQPRAGWGTVRGYQTRNKGNGRADLRFYFVPDDGGEPQFFELADIVPAAELGEYARGFMHNGSFDIKVSAETMAEVEQTFHQINGMDLAKRKKMFGGGNDLHADAGWAWTPDYHLVKVAPGLVQNSPTPEAPTPPRSGPGFVLLNGRQDLEVVGESFYQDNLWRLARAQPGGERVSVEITAVLAPEYENPHDPNAVGVWIDRLRVGYLSRDDARDYRPGLLALQRRHNVPVALPGVITGGGIRRDGPGRLGVFLSHDPADFGL